MSKYKEEHDKRLAELGAEKGKKNKMVGMSPGSGHASSEGEGNKGRAAPSQHRTKSMNIESARGQHELYVCTQCLSSIQHDHVKSRKDPAKHRTYFPGTA